MVSSCKDVNIVMLLLLLLLLVVVVVLAALSDVLVQLSNIYSQLRGVPPARRTRTLHK